MLSDLLLFVGCMARDIEPKWKQREKQRREGKFAYKSFGIVCTRQQQETGESDFMGKKRLLKKTLVRIENMLMAN